MVEDQVLLIDKPADMTSFGVVARLRRVLSKQLGKKVKVGHTGTLDPFATGLMIIVTGKECKNAGHYTKLDKTYEATIRLGESSTTGDPEGEITTYHDDASQSFPQKRLRSGSQIDSPSLETRAADVSAETIAHRPTINEVTSVLHKFTGEIQQRPPIFSAIKIDGQRAYKLARDGKEIELPLRTITIHSLELLSYDYPELRIRTHVSSGTYIRSLAVDIGSALGTHAYCSELRRMTVGEYTIDNAHTLNEFGITD